MANEEVTGYVPLRDFMISEPGQAAAGDLIRRAAIKGRARGLSAEDFLFGGLMALVQLASTGDEPSRRRFAGDMGKWATALREGSELVVKS